MKQNVSSEKSISFAISIIEAYKILTEVKKEYILSKQLLRSGTAIGALLREAEHAESKADFLHKINIALKEANETEYWLMLLNKGKYLDGDLYNELNDSCNQLIRILASIVKTTKQNLKR